VDFAHGQPVARSAGTVRRLEHGVPALPRLARIRCFHAYIHALADEPDLEYAMVNATIVKVHPPRSGRKRMTRPVGKRFVSDDLSSLRKRIRPFSMVPLAKIEIRASWSS